MPSLPDTDLDKLLQEAYGKYEMGKDTNAWEKMSLVLDEHLPQKKEKKRRFFFLLLLFFAVGGAAVSISTGIGHRTSSSATPMAVSSSPQWDNRNPAGKPNTQTDYSRADRSRGLYSFTDSAVNGQSYVGPATQPRYGRNYPAGHDTITGIVLRVHSDGEAANLPSAKGTKAAPEPSKYDRRQLLTPPSGRRHRAPTAKEFPGMVASPSLSYYPLSIRLVPVSPGRLPISGLPIASTCASASGKNQAKNNKAPKAAGNKTNHFEAGILAGVDETSVRFNSTTNAGYNIGVLLGYSFNRRWSLTSGLTYTKKDYIAGGSDYHAPKDHFVNAPGVVLQKADGLCSMLEIPLNVKYNFAVRKKTNLFFSSGVSSYIMLQEAYTFYGTDSGIAFKRGLDGDEVLKKGFWLSVLNLSFGYEKRISKRLSFQAEPYLKVPLQGIGFGKVRMDSYGINFAIKIDHFHR